MRRQRQKASLPYTVRSRGRIGSSGWSQLFFGPNLPTGVTFTRASSGRYWNLSGVNTNALTDVARFDTNPSTLSPRGLLVEGQTTNLLLQSRKFNTTWVLVNVALTGGQAGLFGDNAAFKMTGTMTGSRVQQTVTVTSGAPHYVYAFVKPDTTTSITLRVDNTSAIQVVYNTTNMKTSPTGSPTNIQFYSVGNGWYFIGFSYTSTSTSAIVYIYSAIGTIYLDGLQFAQAAFPASFIPTTTAAATRAADISVITNLASIGFNQNAGTLIVEFEPSTIAGSNTFYIAQISDGTENNVLQMRVNNSTGFFRFGQTKGGVATLGNTSNAVTVLGRNKAAITWSQNSILGVLNGGDVVTLTPAESLPTVSALYIGRSATSFNLNGWVRKVTLYPGRLPDAQLQALTV